MRIKFERMGYFPNRDASWYFAASVFDDQGVRYPVRVMIEGVALQEFNAEVPEPHEDIVLALYRQEIEALVRLGELTPENEKNTVNVVFFVQGGQSSQMQPGDIPVYNADDKLKAKAREMGRI